jgi:hypothetical protein
MNSRRRLPIWLRQNELLLIDTLEGVIDPETERAWRVEIAKRMAELDGGAVTTVPQDEVQEGLRKIIDGPSA